MHAFRRKNVNPLACSDVSADSVYASSALRPGSFLRHVTMRGPTAGAFVLAVTKGCCEHGGAEPCMVGGQVAHSNSA